MIDLEDGNEYIPDDIFDGFDEFMDDYDDNWYEEAMDQAFGDN